MKIRILPDSVSVEFRGAEAKAFTEELLDIPGGARRPKIREVAEGLSRLFGLNAASKEEESRLHLVRPKRKDST